jgi:hypothetical protein
LLVVLLWYLWPAVLAGQIYQYQDEFGNWNFTDDPPEEYESSIVPDIATSYNSSRNRDPDHDLVTRLESAYEPSTPIAYATLAVVSIRTDSVEGSGFFCSDDGHILTSKHVVRPEASEGLAGRQRELAEREQKLKAIDGDLKESRDQLRLMNQDLEGYEGLIADTRDAETRAWAEDAHARLSQRYRSEKGKISAMEKSVRTLGSDLRRTSRELGSAQGFAMSETRFEIILKDGTELVADLLEVSDDQDLALLKLDGYRTPFLNMDPSQQLSQGVRVFAIGNPLGMQDAVTSGVVTQITPEYLLTDTQILPGSSGSSWKAVKLSASMSPDKWRPARRSTRPDSARSSRSPWHCSRFPMN